MTRCSKCGEPATKFVCSRDALGGDPTYGSFRTFACDACADEMIARFIAGGFHWVVQPMRIANDPPVLALK